MKIAITTAGETLAAPIANCFGRAPNYIIYDTKTDEWTLWPNPALKAKYDVGVKVAQMLINHEVEVVISGDIGPHAARVLASAGVRMFVASRTVQEMLADFQQGQLKQFALPAGVGNSDPGGMAESLNE
jgi:predicted Fe-Mo cluster-binding NifX family protein